MPRAALHSDWACVDPWVQLRRVCKSSNRGVVHGRHKLELFLKVVGTRTNSELARSLCSAVRATSENAVCCLSLLLFPLGLRAFVDILTTIATMNTTTKSTCIDPRSSVACLASSLSIPRRSDAGSPPPRLCILRFGTSQTGKRIVASALRLDVPSHSALLVLHPSPSHHPRACQRKLT